MIADVQLRTKGELNQTFYNRYGDWFGWSCCAITAMQLTAVMFGRKTTSLSDA
jgi:apolipoprotein N-acyltransferase